MVVRPPLELWKKLGVPFDLQEGIQSSSEFQQELIVPLMLQHGSQHLE